MSAMTTMIAARVHKQGEQMRLDRIPVPEPRSTDVLVEVKACGIVPNLVRVIANVYGSPTVRLEIPARSAGDFRSRSDGCRHKSR